MSIFRQNKMKNQNDSLKNDNFKRENKQALRPEGRKAQNGINKTVISYDRKKVSTAAPFYFSDGADSFPVTV